MSIFSDLGKTFGKTRKKYPRPHGPESPPPLGLPALPKPPFHRALSVEVLTILEEQGKSSRRNGFPVPASLLLHLRSQGQFDEISEMLADWFDPNCDSEWRLIIKRRGKGRPRKVSQIALDRLAEMEADKNAAQSGSRKNAIGKVAKNSKLTDSAIEARIGRSKKRRKK